LRSAPPLHHLANDIIRPNDPEVADEVKQLPNLFGLVTLRPTFFSADERMLNGRCEACGGFSLLLVEPLLVFGSEIGRRLMHVEPRREIGRRKRD
jgi:hypothetical protein